MSKKDKPVFALADEFQAISSIIPKIEAFIKAHKEIAAGYQKYRKNGGASIPGIEKHFGIKEQKSVSSSKTKKTASRTKAKLAEGKTEATKEKKKVKK